MTTTVTILTKEPSPGQVKTRLAADIGVSAAAEVHTGLLFQTLRKVRSTDFAITVALDGDIAGPFADRLRGEGLHVEPQAHGSLGDRLKHALRSPGRNIALGSDCVVFEVAWLMKAATCSAPVAIGPADDGGYWAIGVDNGTPSVRDVVFDDMPWSEDSLFQQTLERLESNCIDVEILPRSYDIDTYSDLKRLLNDARCPQPLRTVLSGLL